MKRKWLSIVLLVGILCGCKQTEGNSPLEWLPDSLPPSGITESVVSDVEKNIGDVLTDEVGGQVISVPESSDLYTAEELYAALEEEDGRTLADMLWNNQLTTGLYSCTVEELKEKNMLTYYISSSEGDDKNSGRTPDAPRKTIEGLLGVSNVNILLKCGDVFYVSDTVELGSNVTLAAYGEGARPILDFYQPLAVTWSRDKGEKNVWYADLSEVELLYNGTQKKSDCNIGQLVIDGECNWKRYVKPDGADSNYAEYLSEAKDGSFAVDWETGVLYLYSEESPAQKEIFYSLPKHAVTLSNVTNTVVMGLEIKGAGFHGISMSGVNKVKISNCYIHHIGGGLLKDRGPRYGNAVEVWDNGSDVLVVHNMAEWIYDTCYTNQGSTRSMVQQNIKFARNIGRYSFWGIETWGDGISDNEFSDIVYEENLMMHACDLTNTEAVVYVNEKEQVMDANGGYYETYPAYRTYRGHASSYPYNQMSLLNASNSKKKESLVINNNVFYGTNRVLSMLRMTEDGEIKFVLEDNVFYAEVPSEACAFRYTTSDNRRIFVKGMEIESNKALLSVNGSDDSESSEQANASVCWALDVIANGIQ